MEITYRKYVQQIPNTRNSCPNFVMIQPKVIFDTMENKRKCEEWCWGQMVEYLEELVFIKDFKVDTFNVIQWQLNNEKTKHKSRDVHLGQIHYILRATIFCIMRFTQVLNAPRIVTLKHYQQCLPHPLKVGANCKYKKMLKEYLFCKAQRSLIQI